MSSPAEIAAAVDAKRATAEGVLDHIEPGADLIVGMANSEPASVLDAIEAGADGLADVRLHQLFPVRERAYIRGRLPGLRHVSWFLSPVDREPFHAGECELVPNNFSEVPQLMRSIAADPLVVATVSAPDRHGYFSLGTHADYVAAFVGECRYFVEVNPRMPRTFGENQIHISQVLGWCEAETPMFTLPEHAPSAVDIRIAELVAERVPDGATLQAGIGGVPDMVLATLVDRRDLGIHTELFSDGFVELIERGAVTGTRKRLNRNKAVTTNAIGSQRTYDFVGDNPGVEFWPVGYTNDPANIGREPRFTAINATLEVDFLGQCASESIGASYYSSSGGQGDFARGALMSDGGQSFTVLRSTASNESISRIVPELHPGAAVTTHKNVVDKVVTEHGVAELRGSSIRERTRKLISIADPKFRDDLGAEAREMGYL